VTLHAFVAGAGPGMIWLHGFPASWSIWRSQLHHFAQRFRVVAPDGRGVNRSSKPAEVEAYRIDRLAQDVIGLADTLGMQQFVLVGHDWGGTVAWKVAQQYPARITKLVVLNAPPLEAFLYALATIPEQQIASAYMARLKASDAAQLLLANRCEILWQASFGELQRSGIWGAADRNAMEESWQIPGALESFLNWYRANIPEPGSYPVDDVAPERVSPITVPALLVWGEHERAFTPQLLAWIPAYAPRVRIAQIAGAGHWVMLEQPERLHALIEAFLGEKEPEWHP
jgi:epoxide hydrolase 4